MKLSTRVRLKLKRSKSCPPKIYKKNIHYKYLCIYTILNYILNKLLQLKKKLLGIIFY